MNFHAASYFAGIGTVLATLTLGFGGGVLMSEVIADKTPRESSKVAQQKAERARPVEPPAVAATPVVVAAIPQSEVAPAPRASPPPEPEPALSRQAQPQPRPAQARPSPQPPVTAHPVTAHPVTAHNAPPNSAPRWWVVRVPAVQEHVRTSDDKAQEAKRRAAEKRKTERDKQRAERKRQQFEQAQRQLQAEAQQQQAQSAAQRGAEAEDEDRERRLSFSARERPAFFRAPSLRLFDTD